MPTAQFPERLVVVNGQNVHLPGDPSLGWCMVPEAGMKIRVPGYTEINGRNTIEYMHALAQDKWTHISTGPLFKTLFHDVFDPNEGGKVKIPKNVADFPDAPDDVLHISGMIIMAFEALMERKESIYLNKPEEHLHPAQCRCLMTMIYKLRQLAGIRDPHND